MLISCAILSLFFRALLWTQKRVCSACFWNSNYTLSRRVFLNSFQKQELELWFCWGAKEKMVLASMTANEQIWGRRVVGVIWCRRKWRSWRWHGESLNWKHWSEKDGRFWVDIKTLEELELCEELWSFRAGVGGSRVSGLRKREGSQESIFN